MIHRYGLYGLTIETNQAIAGMLDPVAGTPVVTIDFAGVGEPMSASHRPMCAPEPFQTLWELGEDRWLLRYESMFDDTAAWSVLIERDRLTVRWSAAVDPTDIPTVLQGGALACLLLLRGIPALHAAAIDIGGCAILVLGDSGAGKSTTAASLLRRGCALIADDTAALELSGGEVLVHPGLPRLRVLEDSARALGWSVSELASVFHSSVNGRKWYIDVGVTSSTPLAVKAIYVLRRRNRDRVAAAINTLRPSAALGELLRHSHAAVIADIVHSRMLFGALRSVTELVPVREVHAVDSFDELPALAEALVARA